MLPSFAAGTASSWRRLPPEPSRPQWAQVDLRGVRVERVREFGQVYLALSLWRRLGLHTLLRELIESGRRRCLGN